MTNFSAKAVLPMIAGVIVGAFLGLTFGMWLGVIVASGIESFHGEMIVKVAGGLLTGGILGSLLGLTVAAIIFALAQKYLEISVPRKVGMFAGVFTGLFVGVGGGAILHIDQVTLGMFIGFIGILAGGSTGALGGIMVAKKIVARNQLKPSTEDQARDDQIAAFYREKSKQ